MRSGIDWRRIETFIGYGRLDAPVVFLGMEEGQSKLISLAADLRHRSKFRTVMDLRQAHFGIDGTARFFDAVDGATQRTWRPMCHVMLRRKDSGAAPTTWSRLQYQALHLGRTHGDSLLMELLPYPKRRAAAWPELYRKRYQTRLDYEQQLLDKRIEHLSPVLRKHARKLVIGYGKGNWNRYKKLIKDAFGVVDQEWMPSKPFRGTHGAEVALAGKTRILLLQHFSCSAFNSQEQLEYWTNIALA